MSPKGLYNISLGKINTWREAAPLCSFEQHARWAGPSGVGGAEQPLPRCPFWPAWVRTLPGTRERRHRCIPPTAPTVGRLTGLAMLFLLLILSGLGQLTSLDHFNWGKLQNTRAARHSIYGRGECHSSYSRTQGQASPSVLSELT